MACQSTVLTELQLVIICISIRENCIFFSVATNDSFIQFVSQLVDFLSDKQQLIKYWIIVSLRCSSPSSSSSLSLLLSVNGNFYSRYCCWTQFYGYTYYCGLSTNRLLNREMRWSCHEWRWWKSHGYTHKKIIKAKFKKSGKTILIAKSSWELEQWPADPLYKNLSRWKTVNEISDQRDCNLCQCRHDEPIFLSKTINNVAVVNRRNKLWFKLTFESFVCDLESYKQYHKYILYSL